MVDPLPFFDVEVRVDKALVGSKCAYLFGDRLAVVSPAMGELMANADPEELQRLLKAIPVKRLPPLPDFGRFGEQLFTFSSPSAPGPSRG